MKSKCPVCDTAEAIYKCPNCELPFCSVKCGKLHKTTSCQRVQLGNNQVKQQSKQRQNDNESVEEKDILSSEQCDALNEDEEIQRKIRDERLMAILERIDQASNRARALEKEMQNPEFLEFCDDVLEALDMKESVL